MPWHFVLALSGSQSHHDDDEDDDDEDDDDEDEMEVGAHLLIYRDDCLAFWSC